MEDLGYEVDLAVADANSRIWEMMNPPETEEPEDEEPEYNLYSAEYELEYGIDDLRTAMGRIEKAADEAEGHPVSAKIRAAHMTLEKTHKWLKELLDSIGKELIETEKRRYAG